MSVQKPCYRDPQSRTRNVSVAPNPPTRNGIHTENVRGIASLGQPGASPSGDLGSNIEQVAKAAISSANGHHKRRRRNRHKEGKNGVPPDHRLVSAGDQLVTQPAIPLVSSHVSIELRILNLMGSDFKFTKKISNESEAFLEALYKNDFKNMKALFDKSPNNIDRSALMVAYSRLLGHVKRNIIEADDPLLASLKIIFEQPILNKEKEILFRQRYQEAMSLAEQRRLENQKQ